MLAQHRIIFLDREFLGHGAGVLLGDIEKAASAFAVEANFGCGRFGHGGLQKEADRRRGNEAAPRFCQAGQAK